MREVEHEVVGVGNLERLDLLGLMADLANSGLDIVLSLHESIILGLDLANNTGGVNIRFPLSPVDGGELTVVAGGLVEEIKDRLDLSELVATLVSVRGHSESVDPLVGQILV